LLTADLLVVLTGWLPLISSLSKGFFFLWYVCVTQCDRVPHKLLNIFFKHKPELIKESLQINPLTITKGQGLALLVFALDSSYSVLAS